jgi:NADH dehydrogenase FAD-containing subunit
MSTKIVIIGVGFAGFWSALSAKHLIDLKGKGKDVDVIVIAPQPALVMRPRLYEANPAQMSYPVGPVFEALGVKLITAFAEKIDTEAHSIHVRSTSGVESTVTYDRLILAAGSKLIRPQSVIGLQQHSFDIDSMDGAAKLDAHLEQLATLPESTHRDTIVVCGAGFTGIELVTEIPKRISHLPKKPRLVLVDNSDVVGSTLGPGPRRVITQAMEDLGIDLKLGSPVASVDPEGLTLASGERIESNTVVWTAGVRASPLAQQIPGPRDTLSRLFVDKHLRVPTSQHVFATGDVATAMADTKGHYAMMSCQHALMLGRVSGFNAAADLLGEPLADYSQPEYVCCLDLGAWGTVVSHGWDREVKLTGDVAKRYKRFINQKLIYPPESAQEAIALAVPPADANSANLFETILQAVA